MKKKLKQRKPIIKNKKEKAIATKEFLYKFRWRILGAIIIIALIYFILTIIVNAIPAYKYDDWTKMFRFEGERKDYGLNKSLGTNYHIFNWNIFSLTYWNQMWKEIPQYSDTYNVWGVGGN